MRFIVDRCAGKRIAERLREQGHDVAVAWDEEPDPGDAELLARAARENRVLVTMDKDFGEHVFARGSPHCGLVRLPDVPAARRVALMEAVLNATHTISKSVQSSRSGESAYAFHAGPRNDHDQRT